MLTLRQRTGLAELAQIWDDRSAFKLNEPHDHDGKLLYTYSNSQKNATLQYEMVQMRTCKHASTIERFAESTRSEEDMSGGKAQEWPEIA